MSGTPDLGERVTGVETRVTGLEQARVEDVRTNREAHAELWTNLNRIRDRPPVWATAVISILMFGLGVAATLAAKR